MTTLFVDVFGESAKPALAQSKTNAYDNIKKLPLGRFDIAVKTERIFLIIYNKKINIENSFMELIFLKNIIKVSRFFWRYRHIVQPNVWQGYAEDYTNPRRQIYSDFVKEKDAKTVFDFGCGGGANLKRIAVDSSNTRLKFIGFDVNAKALEVAKILLEGCDFIALRSVDSKSVSKSLSEMGAINIDLAIYDRVLYLLSEREVNQHFEAVSKFIKYIIIDDFVAEKQIKHDGYVTRNYPHLLEKHGFSIASTRTSKTKMVANFFWKMRRR